MAIDDFHKTDWDSMAKAALQSMPEKDQAIIKLMFKEKMARGNTDRTLEKTARDLRLFWTHYAKGKPLADLSLDDLKEAFTDLFRSTSSYYTILDYRKHLKQFYKQALGDKYNPIHFEFMNGSTKLMSKKKSQMQESKDILEQEEVERLIAAVPKWRDKAYIMVAFDIMARGGDLTKLRIKDVTRKNEDVWLHLPDTKEGASNVGLTFSAPHLLKWLSLHPDPQPEQFVFCTTNKGGKVYRRWSYRGIYAMLKLAFKTAHIQKKAGLHVFRRSGATFWKLEGADDQTIENRGNWSRGSKALRESYYRVNTVQSHEQAKSLITGKPVKKEEVRFKPVICLNCQWANPPGTEWCQNCHHKASVESYVKERTELDTMKAQMAEMQAQMDKMRMAAARGTVLKAKQNSNKL